MFAIIWILTLSTKSFSGKFDCAILNTIIISFYRVLQLQSHCSNTNVPKSSYSVQVMQTFHLIIMKNTILSRMSNFVSLILSIIMSLSSGTNHNIIIKKWGVLLEHQRSTVGCKSQYCIFISAFQNQDHNLS